MYNISKYYLSIYILISQGKHIIYERREPYWQTMLSFFLSDITTLLWKIRSQVHFPWPIFSSLRVIFSDSNSEIFNLDKTSSKWLSVLMQWSVQKETTYTHLRYNTVLFSITSYFLCFSLPVFLHLCYICLVFKIFK